MHNAFIGMLYGIMKKAIYIYHEQILNEKKD